MSSKIQYRWILFLLIWLGGFYLSYTNIETISEIVSNREKAEILQMDMAFWKQNSSNISRVLDQRRSLNHEIESLKLGLVFLNDTINRLGDKFDLSELKVERASARSQGNSMRMSLSYKGILKNGIEAISTIQRDYPFLPFQMVKILPGQQGGLAEFDISLNYRYLVVDTR